MDRRHQGLGREDQTQAQKSRERPRRRKAVRGQLGRKASMPKGLGIQACKHSVTSP